MKEQDGRRLVWVVQDRLGRFVEVVDKRHSWDRGAAAVEVMCHKRPQAARAKAAQASRPCANSEYHLLSLASRSEAVWIVSGIWEFSVSSESRI